MLQRYWLQKTLSLKQQDYYKVINTPIPGCFITSELFDKYVSRKSNIQVKATGTHIFIDLEVFWIIKAWIFIIINFIISGYQHFKTFIFNNSSLIIKEIDYISFIYIWNNIWNGKVLLSSWHNSDYTQFIILG